MVHVAGVEEGRRELVIGQPAGAVLAVGQLAGSRFVLDLRIVNSPTCTRTPHVTTRHHTGLGTRGKRLRA